MGPNSRRRSARSWIAWSAVALAGLGWWLSLDLLRIGWGAAATNPWLEATCGPTQPDPAQLDCPSVLRSRWASVVMGDPEKGLRIPIAAYGMAYFALVGLWYAFVGAPTRPSAAWHLLIAAIVLAGVVVSLQLLHVMALVLRRWCAGCLVAHAVNAGLLLLTVAAWPWRRPATPVVKHPTARLALAALVGGVSVALLHLVVTITLLSNNTLKKLNQAYAEIVTDPQFVRWHHGQQPVETLLLREEETDPGSPEAPNTVVAFIDFQCSACRVAHEVLSRVQQQHPGRLRVVYRHYPQDAACNPGFKTRGHSASCRAAQAAEAALLLGGAAKRLAMQELLYEHQRDLESEPFTRFAQALALDVVRFRELMDSPQVAQRIGQDVALAAHLKIQTVPVLFLNGRRLEHWRHPATWSGLLGDEPPGNKPLP